MCLTECSDGTDQLTEHSECSKAITKRN